MTRFEASDAYPPQHRECSVSSLCKRQLNYRKQHIRQAALVTCASFVFLQNSLRPVSCFSSPLHHRSFSMGPGCVSSTNSVGKFRAQSPRARNSSGMLNARKTQKSGSHGKAPKKPLVLERMVLLYLNYVARLWKETDPDVRSRIATDKAMSAIKRVEHIMRGEEYVDLGASRVGESLEEVRARTAAKQKLLEACQLMLACMVKLDIDPTGEEIEIAKVLSANSRVLVSGIEEGEGTEKDTFVNGETSLTQDFQTTAGTDTKTTEKKPRRSILFGATMGLIAACWVFSGNYIFTGLFTLLTVLVQLEYYRMVMNAGIYPARRISVLGACSMFITALFFPAFHQICLPVFGMIAMIWFLTMRRQVSTISEIATTFTGMFYLGYIPSFWVRIRLIGSRREPTRLAPIVAPMLSFLGRQASNLPAWLPNSFHLPITTGAVFIFWTWLCIAFSDVGAYFAGRRFGKTKLGVISPAAGATSPNKTVEGFFGGCLVSAVLATAGAWVQRWPYWYVFGPLHGILLGILGLIGDLTASMLKRDAGLKDFGDLIPEHGGIMDRADSFIFTAPYSWLMCQFVIPALKTFTRAGTIIP